MVKGMAMTQHADLAAKPLTDLMATQRANLAAMQLTDFAAKLLTNLMAPRLLTDLEARLQTDLDATQLADLAARLLTDSETSGAARGLGGGGNGDTDMRLGVEAAEVAGAARGRVDGATGGLGTDLAVAPPVDLVVAAMATRTRDSASRLLKSTELLTDVAVAQPEDLSLVMKPQELNEVVAVPFTHTGIGRKELAAELLAALAVAAMATRISGAVSKPVELHSALAAALRTDIAVEILAALVVAPPEDLASETKPLEKAGMFRDLVVTLCVVVVEAALAALVAAILAEMASSTMATWPPDPSERQAELVVLGVLSRRGGGAWVGAISVWEAREDEGDRARVSKTEFVRRALGLHPMGHI
ncbi:hypothetical protein PR002_g11157 [Phytophthora rubi]|uniref:Uncharacterized protein n=1 Tax=Phytophthora rubi TaxID=129364 RepID=A0A6A3MBH2_9STRA|nr:hypothetical protein PR002_g11157 [Phytophthora rubi]